MAKGAGQDDPGDSYGESVSMYNIVAGVNPGVVVVMRAEEISDTEHR